MALDTVDLKTIVDHIPAITVGYSNADYLVNGGTDDNIQIQRAIDEAYGRGFGVAYLKGPRFTISTGLLGYDNTILKGDGIGATTLTRANNTNINMITNADTTNGNSNIAIMDMTIDGNKANQNPSGNWGRGIKFTKVTKPVVQNVEIVDCDNRAVHFDTCTDGWIRDCYGIDCGFFQEQNFTFERCVRCYFSRTTASGGKDQNYNIAYSTNCGFYDVISIGGQGAGIGLFGSSSGGNNDGIIIDGFMSIDDESVALRVERTKNFEFSNIWIKDSTGEGIRSFGDTTVFENGSLSNVNIYSPGNNGILLAVPHLTATNVNVYSAGSDGFRSQGIESKLSNVNVFGAGTNAIQLEGNYSSLTNCTGKNAGTSNVGGNKNGLRLNASHCQINNSNFFDDQEVGTQDYGVREIGTADYNTIYGCDVTGVSAPILKLGTNTKVRNNQGYITEAAGTATIPSGTTNIAVNHGLSVTPTLKDISVTLGENPTSDPGNIWVSGMGTAQFIINCRNDPGASGLDLAWKAIVL